MSEHARSARCRLAAIVENSDDAMIEITTDGIIEYWNPAAERIFGYLPQEVCGDRLIAIFARSHRKEFRNALEKVNNREIAEWVELEGIKKSRAKFDMLFRLSPICEERCLVGALAVIRDISERKRFEEELRSAEERARIIFENAPDAYYLMDLKGTFVDANKAAEEVSGFKKHEALGKTFVDIEALPPREAIKAFGQLAKNALGMPTGPDLWTWKRKDGRVIKAEEMTYPVRLNGKIYVLGIARDITQRIEAEEALTKSEERYRALAEAAHDIIFIVDRERRITYINSFAAKVWLSRPEAIVGKKIDMFCPGVCREHWETTLRNVFDTGEPDYLDSKVSLPAGDVCLSVWMSPIKTASGEVDSVLGIARDITAMKTAQELSDSLNSINMAINSTVDFGEIMRKVVVDAADAIGCDAALIITKEEEHWINRYAHGLPGQFDNLRVREPSILNLLSQFSSSGEKVLVSEDAFRDRRFNRAITKRFGIRSVLGIPLSVKGKTIGVLAFLNLKEAVGFIDSQIDFAIKLAVSISFAIENTRLYKAQQNIAVTLQQALLTIPTEIRGIDFFTLYRSATEAMEVGGDFYDIFELEGERVGIVIGDVSGKGLDAATSTSLVKDAIKAHAQVDNSPGSIMTKVNELAVRVSTQAAFSTVFFGILDTRSGVFTYSNAGHPPPILKRKDSTVSFLSALSPVVGAFGGLRFSEETVELGRDDLILLYTDGVTEARRERAGEMFGEERLVKCVKGSASPKEVPLCTLGSVLAFSGGKLPDDVAILVISLHDIEAMEWEERAA